MQSQMSNVAKKYGHCRRPSFGKSMPISSLLLNYSQPPPSHHSLSRDGTSPDRDCPPTVFHVNDDDYSVEADTQEFLNNERNECVNADDEFVFVPAPRRSCDFLTAVVHEDFVKKDAIAELCNLLCDSTCKSKKDLLAVNQPKDVQRQQFLSNTPVTISIDSVPEMQTNQIMDKQEFREKLAVAEALARTSMMTSPAAKRRLAARKIEMDINADSFNNATDEDFDYVPPKQLLMYLVRMGSFNSAPKINNADTQDDYLEVPHGLSTNDLVQHCRLMRGENQPQLLSRDFLKPTSITNDLTDGMRVLKLNTVSKGTENFSTNILCSPPVSSPNNVRLFQWNVLSQSLGQSNDGFVCCPDEALTWDNRKYLIIQEIIQNDPDVVCLQEVDHFKFLQSILGTQDYEGIFFPKPDSPCLYISQNNGPDGCAIFYKKNKYELVNYDTRILEVWRVQSNQVAIAANLRVLENNKEFCVCTTHLKARHGSLLSKLRNEQGKDLLRFVNKVAGKNPLLLCGDFNAEPSEPVYSTVLNNPSSVLSSAYADMIASKNMACSEAAAAAAATAHGHKDDDSEAESTASAASPLSRVDILASQEPPFTTWKIREDGEVCHTIDYVFYSQDTFKVNNCLMFPYGSEIGKDRTPSFRYPSDHFSLVCDFEFKDTAEQST